MMPLYDFFDEYSKPMFSFGVLLTTIVMILRSRHAKPSRSDEEREDLRSRLVEAAENRLRPIQDEPKKIIQKPCKGIARETKEKPTTNAPKGPRQATQAEELRYREEKLSQQQFGFSIYGNTDYCIDCVSVAPTTSSRASGFGLGIHSIGVIADLPGSAQVYKELERLRDEFDPLVKARGWKVFNLTEMCCCGDGDEHLSGRTASKSRQRENNVLGYYVGSNDNRVAQGIHIRCRVVNSCRDGLRLYPYAELCHELAHIAVGQHNSRFFQLMKELEDEYVLQKRQHPWGSGQRLGN